MATDWDKINSRITGKGATTESTPASLPQTVTQTKTDWDEINKRITGATIQPITAAKPQTAWSAIQNQNPYQSSSRWTAPIKEQPMGTLAAFGKKITAKAGELREFATKMFEETPFLAAQVAYAPEDEGLNKQVEEYESSLSGQYARKEKLFQEGVVTGVTGGIIKPKSADPQGVPEKVISGTGQAIGTVATISQINSILQGAMKSNVTIASLINAYPKVAKYAVPLTQNALSFTAYGQLDPDTQDRFKKAATDVVTSIPYTGLGAIKNTVVSVPASALLGFGLAKMEGASDEDAYIQAGILGALDLVGRVSNVKPYQQGRVNETLAPNDARATINKYSDIKITSRSSAEEIEAAYKSAAHKVHPDKGGSAQDFISVNQSYIFLKEQATSTSKIVSKSDKKDTKTQDSNEVKQIGIAADLQKQFEIRLAEQTAKEKEMRAQSQTQIETANKKPDEVKQMLDSESPIVGVMTSQSAEAINYIHNQLAGIEEVINGTTADLGKRIDDLKKVVSSIAADNDINESAKAAAFVKQDTANLMLTIGDYAVRKAQEAGLNLGKYGGPENSSDDWATFIEEVIERIQAGIKNGYSDKIGNVIADYIEEYQSGATAEIRDVNSADEVRPVGKDYRRFKITLDNGEKINVDYNSRWNDNAVHFEFHTRDPNSISETGYRSHFVMGNEKTVLHGLTPEEAARQIGNELAEESKGNKKGKDRKRKAVAKRTEREKPIVKTKIDIVAEGKDAENQARILMELEGAKAGERIRTVDSDGTEHWIGVPSSFPSWIEDSKLRSRALIDAVLEHINNDTTPTKANEVRLYNLIADRLGLIEEVREIADENDIDVSKLFSDEKIDEQISKIGESEKSGMESETREGSQVPSKDTGLEEKVPENKKYEQLEAKSYEWAVKNTDTLINDYESKEGNFLGGDNIKAALFPDYNKDRTNYLAFRKAGNYLWNKVFDQWLVSKRDNGNNEVLILIGAPAVGKTTSAKATIGQDYLDKYAFAIEVTGHDQKILGSTIDRITDSGFNVHVVQVFTHPDAAFPRMLDRAQYNEGKNDGLGRTVHIPEYVKRAIGSIQLGREYAEKYADPDGTIHYDFISNQGGKGNAKMLTPQEAVDILGNLSYNKKDEEAIISKYYDETLQSLKQGKISQAVADGVTGVSGSPEERAEAMRRIDSARAESGGDRGSKDKLTNQAIEQPPVSAEPKGGFIAPKFTPDNKMDQARDLSSKAPNESPEAFSEGSAEIPRGLIGLSGDIPLSVARRAHSWNSFDPDKAGDYEVRSYMDGMTAEYNKLKELVETPEQQIILDDEFTRFRQGYAGRELSLLSAKSKTASSAVTGSANFNIRRNQKWLDVEHNRYEDLVAYENKALNAIRNKIHPTVFVGTSEKTIEKMGDRLEELKKRQIIMKEANKIIRGKKDVTVRLVELGIPEETAISLQKPDFLGRIGFADYQLTSINNKIKSLEKRRQITQMKREKANTTGNEEFMISGVRAVKNFETNRFQLLFDGRPDQSIIDGLKGRGFRWSRFNKAWQRTLTNQAIRDAQNLLNKDNNKVGQSNILGGVIEPEIITEQDAMGFGVNKNAMESKTGGKSLTSEEYQVAKAEELKQKQSGQQSITGYADVGSFSDGTPVKMGNMDKIMPVETPELIKLVVDLTGKFPSVRKRLGRASGRFYPRTGEIKLKADIFADPIQAAKTLAHEIGHLVDWLPDKAMERGNILGRLFTLRDFLKKTYGTTETLFGKSEGGFPDEIKKTIRNRIVKSVLQKHNITFGEWVSGKVDRVTRQVVSKEINDKARKAIDEEIREKGFIKDETIRKELWEISTYWRPLGENPSADFMSYRKSSPELYADALSVLFNSPGLLEEKAPTFYKLFFQELDNKPEVHEAYWAIQDLLHGAKEELYLARQARMHAGQARAVELEKQYEAKREAGEKHLWTRFVQMTDDKNYPLLKKVSEAEKSGKIIPEEQNPRYVLEELSYMQNDNYLMIDEMNSKISIPLKEAGLNDQDFGDYLELNRDIMGRFDKANPGGFDPKLAAEQLEFMKKSLGAEKFSLLEEKAKIFHEIVFSAVEEGVKVGSINSKVFEEKLLPNKDNYAAFRVVDHLTDHVSGTIKKQIGTFKEIKNPYYATIQTTAALNNLNNIQKAKNSVRDFLAANFPDEILKSRVIRDKRLSIFKAGEGKSKLEMMEDGRMVSYDVDPMIAEIFNKESVATVNLLGRILNTVFVNDITKSLFTTWNAGFTIFNLKRDASATFKAIPKASIFGLGKEYARALPSAYRFARGKLDERTRPLVEGKMIATPQSGSAYSNENEMDIIERRFGLQDKDSRIKRFVLARPIISFFNGVSIASNTLEVLSKIAGTELRTKYGESGKVLAHNVRTYTGTPNYKVRGSVTAISNEVWLFSNIMIKGMKRDWQLGTDPATRSGYWIKTLLIDILPKALMAAALYGMFGDDLKDQFEKMSEYDKTNYLVLPLGETEDGKAIYARLPHDEMGQIYSALFWKIATAAQNNESLSNLLTDVFGFVIGRGPGVTPAIGTTVNWLQFWQAKNPYDSYRGRNIIDDTTFTAGGWASTKKMIEWTSNNYGLTSFSTYDPAKNTTFETTMQMLPGINRIFKVSDYGLTEKQDRIQQKSDQQRARELLQEKDIIGNYALKYRKDKAKFYFEGEAENAIKDILGHEPETEDEENRADNVRKKFNKEIIKIAGSSMFKSVAYATQNREKVQILSGYKDKMDEQSFADMLNEMLADKLISQAVYDEIM